MPLTASEPRLDPFRRVGSHEEIDAQMSFSGIKRLRLDLGVKNLLDRDPPASDQGQSFQVGYDPRLADPHGRTYYATLRYRFK